MGEREFSGGASPTRCTNLKCLNEPPSINTNLVPPLSTTTPPHPSPGKSGNINNVLKQMYGGSEGRVPGRELVCVFDADQVASREFFLKTVPLFDGGDDVGMVLSPQVRGREGGREGEGGWCVCVWWEGRVGRVFFWSSPTTPSLSLPSSASTTSTRTRTSSTTPTSTSGSTCSQVSGERVERERWGDEKKNDPFFPPTPTTHPPPTHPLGYDALGFISCTGTNFLVRSRALLEVGGSPTWTLTEDFALGMELKRAGWHCR